MVIRELLKKAADILDNNGIGDSYNEAAVLLSYAMGNSKTYLYTHMDDEADDDIVKCFLNYVNKRSERVPVAYITGTAWFMSLELNVNESTLIPRPETEELVDEVLGNIKKLPGDKIDVLDMCTGTGCIGIAVSYYDKRVNAVLSDINPGCIGIAKRNAEKYNLSNRITLVHSDLYDSIQENRFDVITANPPYIPSMDIPGLESDVKDYEPMAALDGGADGLDFYRNIIAGSKNYLKDNGSLIMELGIGQSETVPAMLHKNGFSDISIKNDISGIPRIVTARIKQK